MNRYADTRMIILCRYFPLPLLAICVLLSLFPADAYAAAYFSDTGGTWNGANRWRTGVGASCTAGSGSASGAAYPGSAATADTATICTGDAIILSVSPANAIASLTTVGTGSLAFGNSVTVRTLTVSGNIINAGTINVANFTANHVLNVGGNITNNGTFDMRLDADSRTNVTFTGGGTHTVDGTGAGATEFRNLTVNNNLIINKTAGAAITQTGNLTVNGNLTITTGTLTISGADAVLQVLTVSGDITNAGTFNLANVTLTHTLSVAGDIQNNGTFDLALDANTLCNLTYTGGTTHTLSGNGATTDFNNVTVNNNLIVNMSASGTTVTQTGTLNVNGTLDVQGGTYNLTNFVLVDGTTTIGGSAAVTATLGITNTTSTKTFTGMVTVNAFGTWSNAVATTITFSAGLDINNDGGGNNGTFSTSGASVNTITSGGLTNDGIFNSTSSGLFTISGGGLINTGSFTSSGTSNFTFNTVDQDIVCSDTNPVSIATITVTGVTLTNKCDATPAVPAAVTLTVRTALNGTGGLTQDTNASLILEDSGALGITTLTAGATDNTVTYNLAGAQTVKLPAGGDYYNLTLSGSGNKTSVTGTYNILGDMTVDSGPTWLGTGGAPDPAVNITGNLRIDGSFTTGTGAYTLEGDFENNGTFTHTAGGTLTMDSTTAGQTIKGTTAATFRSLTISNTHSAGVSATTNFNVLTTMTVSANALLVPDAGVVINNAAVAGTITGAGTIEVTRTAATADYVSQYRFTTDTLSGLTVNYSGAGAQTINASATVGNYGSLVASGSGTKTPGGNVTVNGDLSVNASGVTLDISTLTANRASAGGTLTVVNGATLSIGGTNVFPTNYSTVALGGTSTVEYYGTAQNVSNEAYGNLTISGSGTKTITGGNATISGTGTLTLNAGLLATGANLLTIGLGGSVSRCVSGTSCFVVGNLVKNFPAGSPTVAWEVGTATASPAYAPVSIDFSGASAGTFQVTTPTADGDHADTTGATAGIDPALSVNRYWTFTRLSGSFTSYAPTFTYGNIAGDVDVGATPANFIIGQKSAGIWEYPAVNGTPTATSASATGVGDANGDDFAVGEALLNLTPLSQWRMNEFAWSGTANEVADSGSGGYHGTAAGLAATKPTTDAASPALAGTPGTCQYGVFDRTNKDYIALPSTYPNLSAAVGGFTITAWIKSADVSNSGQRIVIDDAANANGNWGLTLGEPGPGRLRFYYRQASAFTLDTPGGSPLADDTWYFVAVSVRLKTSGNSSKGSIFVFNTAGTLVTSATANFSATSLDTDTAPPSIGGETNAAGEGTNAFGFDGNIDMVSVYQAELSVNHVRQIRQITHACVFINHIRLEHDGLGLTCAPETVTVKACTNPACSSQYTGGVTTTLSPTGWVGGDTINFSGGTTTANLRHTAVETVILGAGSTTPVVASATRCFNGASETCSLEFKDSGFIFDVPNLTACKTSAAVTMSAVRADLTSQTCAPAFSGARTVNLWSTYLSPATGGSAVSVSGTPVSGSSPGTGINLTFDASAQTTFTVNYPDAGQMQLNARYDGSGAETGLVMLGSDQFIAAPVGLAVYGASSCPAGNDTCPVAGKAGATFNLNTRAACWTSDGDTDLSDNPTTPNFELASIAVGHTLVAPAAGTPGAIAATSFNFTTADAGVHTLSQSVSEVGVFSFTVTPPAYYGVAIAAATSPNIGRFTPDRLEVTANTPVFAHSCAGGAFTYLEQPFYFGTAPELTVTGRNVAGGTTMNYGGNGVGGNDFWMLSTVLANRSYDDAGQPLFGFVNGNNAALGSAANYDGQGTLSLTAGSSGGDSFMYGRGAVPVAPFNADVDATFTANDLTDDDSVCYDPDDNDTCDLLTVIGITGSGVGTAQQRFGRLIIGEGVSSELITMNVPLTAEYYNGTNYVLNTDDVCTGIADNELTLSNTYESAQMDGDIRICEAGGTTSMTVTNDPFAAGDGLLTFTAPGAACEGFTDILIDLSSLNLNHLRFDWDDDDGLNDGPYDDDPRGRATFGIISRPKEIIYTREPWN